MNEYKNEKRKKSESKRCNLTEKYRILESPVKLTNKIFGPVLKCHLKKKFYFISFITILPDNQSLDKTMELIRTGITNPKSLLNSAYLWSRARLAINKNQKHFSLPDYQLGEILIHVFGFYEKAKKG